MRILRRRRGGGLLGRPGVHRVGFDCLIGDEELSASYVRRGQMGGCGIMSVKHIVQGGFRVDLLVRSCLICERICTTGKLRVNASQLYFSQPSIDLYKTCPYVHPKTPQHPPAFAHLPSPPHARPALTARYYTST